MADGEIPMLQLGPVPCLPAIGTVRFPDGTPAIQMFFSSPMGVNAYFISVETAEALLEQLKENITSAKTGLVVASTLPAK